MALKLTCAFGLVVCASQAYQGAVRASGELKDSFDRINSEWPTKAEPPAREEFDEDGPVEEFEEREVEAGVVNPDHLVICCMGCCCINSMYCTFPDCLGCYNNSTYCCFEQRAKCCKPHSDAGKICICVANDCNCIYPTTCCKSISQTCCVDSRCAFPCDDDVPCGLAYFGLVCCYGWAPTCRCCAKLGQLRNKSAAK
jgi:hypothetical protein